MGFFFFFLLSVFEFQGTTVLSVIRHRGTDPCVQTHQGDSHGLSWSRAAPGSCPVQSGSALELPALQLDDAGLQRRPVLLAAMRSVGVTRVTVVARCTVDQVYGR